PAAQPHGAAGRRVAGGPRRSRRAGVVGGAELVGGAQPHAGTGGGGTAGPEVRDRPQARGWAGGTGALGVDDEVAAGLGRPAAVGADQLAAVAQGDLARRLRGAVERVIAVEPAVRAGQPEQTGGLVERGAARGGDVAGER